MSKQSSLGRLFGRLMGRGNNRPSGLADRLAVDNSIHAARVGDVVIVQGLNLDLDDAYLVVEQVHRYAGSGIEWRELAASDTRRQVWLEWSGDGDNLFVTATTERRPVGLDAIGLTEDDLIALDEAHSIDNGVVIEERRYSYRNSFEAFYYPGDRAGEGEGFYMWEFLADDGRDMLAITKFEGLPFEAHFSEIIDPDNVLLYPGERSEAR